MVLWSKQQRPAWLFLKVNGTLLSDFCDVCRIKGQVLTHDYWMTRCVFSLGARKVEILSVFFNPVAPSVHQIFSTHEAIELLSRGCLETILIYSIPLPKYSSVKACRISFICPITISIKPIKGCVIFFQKNNNNISILSYFLLLKYSYSPSRALVPLAYILVLICLVRFLKRYSSRHYLHDKDATHWLLLESTKEQNPFCLLLSFGIVFIHHAVPRLDSIQT